MSGKVLDKYLVDAVSNVWADVSIQTTFEALATELVALSEPYSLMPVVTDVMLIGLDQSLDCIGHNDEEEWASILGSSPFESKRSQL